MGIDERTDVYHGDDRVSRIYYYIGIGTARRVHTVIRCIRCMCITCMTTKKNNNNNNKGFYNNRPAFPKLITLRISVKRSICMRRCI